MKLSESVSFNKKTLKVNGLVNLGNYTPEHQKNSKGDHALVLMYQPFQGKWYQALAVFLSYDCASSTVLHKIVIECVILLKKFRYRCHCN
ncbi:unnamed protein product [Macrosiphum euphorbiae]|uniref:Transposable element P transposase-like RNase H domain-containing protein n=1 Tax=Macrosiphum euphorbiae TaxID=13131 RepID=A0AAV0XXU7_9HEMI|nr:unnamed protein product [Macrosiphum euphorbiae]